jgi:hypothetical protein
MVAYMLGSLREGVVDRTRAVVVIECSGDVKLSEFASAVSSAA